MQPLRYTPITDASSLLQAAPPPCSALVLSPSWGFHLDFSLNIGTTGSHVPYKSLDQVHAISMPDAAQTVNSFLCAYPGFYVAPSFDVTFNFSTPHRTVRLYSSP